MYGEDEDPDDPYDIEMSEEHPFDKIAVQTGKKALATTNAI